MSDVPAAKAKAGVPAWVMTFADLMTLLMCFFVLLLSFAEMDVLKFKQVAGSMREAFGVQRTVPSDRSETEMDFTEGQVSDMPLHEKVGDLDAVETKSLDPQAMEKLLEEMQAEQTEAEALKLAALLSEEIAAGSVELESTTDSVIIRISEKASFPSGRAKLRVGFADVLDKIHSALTEVQGTITVAGHTDNRPIRTKRFRSNWELSAARAVSVLHALLNSGLLDPDRFLVEGHGDAHPLVPNDTAENRARNRRVELTIILRNMDEVLSDELPDEGDTATQPEGARQTPASDPEAGSPDSATLEPVQDNQQLAPPPADLGLQLDSLDAPLEELDTGADSEPAGLEQELPGVDALLPDFDGELDTPAELEQLLRALDAATEDLPLEEE